MSTFPDLRKAQMRRALNWSAWLFVGYLFTTYIVLTDGFTENAMKTFEFLGKCQELFPDYPKIETCITEENCAIVVLTK